MGKELTYIYSYNYDSITLIRKMNVANNLVSSIYVGDETVKSAYVGDVMVYGNVSEELIYNYSYIYYQWHFINLAIYIRPQESYDKLKRLDFSIKVYLDNVLYVDFAKNNLSLAIQNNDHYFKVNEYSIDTIINTKPLNELDVKIEAYFKLYGDYLTDYDEINENKSTIFHVSTIINDNDSFGGNTIMFNDMVYEKDNNNNDYECSGEIDNSNTVKVTSFTGQNYFIKMFIEED